MQNTKQVVQISTNISTGCKHCSFAIKAEDFEASVNHYLSQHGYTLLHVGQETTQDMNGKPWHTTVAVLGRD